MTVAELIEILKDMPQDYTVTARTKYGHMFKVTDIYVYDETIKEIELS